MYSHTCCADYNLVQDYTLCCIAYTEWYYTKGVNCQIFTQKGINFLRSFWKNLHRTEKNYTGTACGACDKYEVWKWSKQWYCRIGWITTISFEKHLQLRWSYCRIGWITTSRRLRGGSWWSLRVKMSWHQNPYKRSPLQKTMSRFWKKIIS